MMNAVRKMLVLFFAGLSTAAFAADSYYWVDSGDHDLMKRENWRLKSVSGDDPESWPPTLDTATSGGTHPCIYIPTSATLSLPNDDSITLNDLIFNTAKTDSVIDLGSKTKAIRLFGNGDAAIWVGQNYPDGERVTLKRGIITRVADTQRNTAIRLGAVYTTGKALSSFILDGPEAVVSNMSVNIASPMCEVVVTNGAKLYVNAKNAVVMSPKTSGSVLRVSGPGSLFRQFSSDAGFFFGDTDADKDVPAGGLEITDGGVVTNASATIGNRSGNFHVTMDNGTWQGQTLTLGGHANGTSTNDTLTVRNGSHLVFTTSIGVGTWGGLGTALIESSELVTPTLMLGARGVGYGYNEMTITNSTFNVSTIVVGGNNGDGVNACNNTLTVRDSVALAKTAFHLSYNYGGGATNHLVLADSTLPIGSVNVGRKGRGHNTLLVTNCTLSAAIQVGGSGSASDCASDSNFARIVDSVLGTPAEPKASFELATSYTGCPSRSNRIELVRTTWNNSDVKLGIGGWPAGTTYNRKGNDGNVMIIDDHSSAVCTNGTRNGVLIGGFGFGNRLEVLNGSTLIAADSIGLGGCHANFAFAGTNVLYVGTDAKVETGYLSTYPGGNIVVVDNGTLSTRFMRRNYFWSIAQGKTVDGMTAAEDEYGKTAKEIWGTRYVFKGAHPVFLCPGELPFVTYTSGCAFDRSCIVSFEFPEEPYANPPLQSGSGVTFGDGTTVEFDLSKVGIAGGKYVLADLTEAGSLTVSATQLAAMQESLTAAATAVGRKARIFVDGKKLVVKVSSNFGMLLIVR